MTYDDFLTKLRKTFKDTISRKDNILDNINMWLQNASIIYRIIELKITDIREGYVKAYFPFKKELTRADGKMIYGGIIMMVIDSIGGIAVFTVNDGYNQSTLELKINFLHSLIKGPFIVIGKVLRTGSVIAVAEVDIYDADEKLCAKGIGTWRIFKDKKG